MMTATDKRRATNDARAFIRKLVVFLLCVWALAISLPAIDDLRHPPGDFGLTVNADLIVDGVTPGSAADAAGIVPGDGIDERSTPLADRHVAPSTRDPAPGDRETLGVIQDGVRRTVTLTAAPQSFSTSSTVEWLVGKLATLLFVAVGALLVLLRPSLTTWGFFLYCIGASPGNDATYYSFLPVAPFIAIQMASIAIIAAGYVGFLLFALEFPDDVPQPAWQRGFRRLLPFLFVAFVGTCVGANVAAGWLGVPAGVLDKLCAATAFLVYAVGIGSFISTYRVAAPPNRQRVRWVMLAVAIALGGITAGIAAPFLPFTIPDALFVALGILGFFVPPIVAYAVLRHRVIDVTFVINRALVYAVITSAIVAVFALIEWLVGHVLSSARIALALEIAAAIGLSFSLNAIHRRVATLVEGLFFRDRVVAQRAIAELAAELPKAESLESIEARIVAEPVRAYGLTGAAFFRRAGADGFRRTQDAGWPPGSIAVLGADDPLVDRANREPEPFHLDDGRLPAVLALPIVVAERLEALALYGAHESGDDLDPEERRNIGALARAAAHAFDHIELVGLRRRTAELEAKLKPT